MTAFRDIESNEIVTIEQLKLEYDQLKKNDPESFDYSFPEYVENCMARNNGTLEKIEK